MSEDEDKYRNELCDAAEDMYILGDRVQAARKVGAGFVTVDLDTAELLVQSGLALLHAELDRLNGQEGSK